MYAAKECTANGFSFLFCCCDLMRPLAALFYMLIDGLTYKTEREREAAGEFPCWTENLRYKLTSSIICYRRFWIEWKAVSWPKCSSAWASKPKRPCLLFYIFILFLSSQKRIHVYARHTIFVQSGVRATVHTGFVLFAICVHRLNILTIIYMTLLSCYTIELYCIYVGWSEYRL